MGELFIIVMLGLVISGLADGGEQNKSDVTTDVSADVTAAVEPAAVETYGTVDNQAIAEQAFLKCLKKSRRLRMPLTTF